MQRRGRGIAAGAAALAAGGSVAGAVLMLLATSLSLPGPAWLVAALAAVVAAATAAAVGRSMGGRWADAIASLADLSDRIIRGDPSARSRLRAHGDLARLAQNLDLVAERVAVLTCHAGERAALETELEVGKRIQELSSPSEPLSVDGVAITGALRPAAPAGGGFWLWRGLPGGRALVAIGDATGRGLPAAMLTATARAAVDVAVAALGEEISPDRVLHLANNAVYASARRAHSMTCFVVILDPQEGTAHCANAGHPFPYVHRRSGRGELEPIRCRGNRLGELRSSEYKPWRTELSPSDAIVLFTEGLVRCEGAVGEAYGEKRLRHVIRRYAGDTPQALCDGIVADHSTFLDGAQPGDDVVVAVAALAPV